TPTNSTHYHPFSHSCERQRLEQPKRYRKLCLRRCSFRPLFRRNYCTSLRLLAPSSSRAHLSQGNSPEQPSQSVPCPTRNSLSLIETCISKYLWEVTDRSEESQHRSDSQDPGQSAAWNCTN